MKKCIITTLLVLLSITANALPTTETALLTKSFTITPNQQYTLSFTLNSKPTKTPNQDNIIKIKVNKKHLATIQKYNSGDASEKFTIVILPLNTEKLTLAFTSLSENAGSSIGQVSLTKTKTEPIFITEKPTTAKIYIPEKEKSNPTKLHTLLFNTKNLNNWNGDTKYFTIKDNAIHAGYLDKNIPSNRYLVTNKKFYNFNLQIDAILLGKKHINGGVQIRAFRVPNSTAMEGYQVDLLNDNRAGRIYDEHRRNKFVNEKLHNHKNANIIKGKFNHLDITCHNSRIAVYLNGYLVSDYIEKDPKIIKQTGNIGLQIHGGPPAKLIYKNIYIKNNDKSKKDK